VSLDIVTVVRAAAAADAGADFESFRQPNTGYSLVQAAAHGWQFEAVIKLVEFGASWRPKRGQEFVGCPSFDMISNLVSNKPDLKVGACVKPLPKHCSLTPQHTAQEVRMHMLLTCMAVYWLV
jgi:hypothetical protein